MQVSFWIAASITAGSFIFGLAANPTIEFAVSWLVGVVGSMSALAASIMYHMNKK